MPRIAPKARIRELFFAAHYVRLLDGTKAAIAAGYAPRSAHSTSTRLLQKPSVKTEIARLRDRQLETLDIRNFTVLSELKAAAHSNVLDYIDVMDHGSFKINLAKCTREQASAIESVQTEEWMDVHSVRGEDGKWKRIETPHKKTRFKLHNKLTALEMLGRYLTLFRETGAPADHELNIHVHYDDPLPALPAAPAQSTHADPITLDIPSPPDPNPNA